MNICIFGSSFLPAVGGKEFVMHNLANALVKNGNDVTVIAKRVSWDTMAEQREYQLKLYGLPVPGSGRIGLDHILSVLTFTALHLRHRFDVVNCHGVDDAGNRAHTLRLLHKVPLVMTPHGIDVQRIERIGYGLRLDPKWDRQICRNLRSADFITAISGSIHEELDMVAESRIVDIPNGIEVSRFCGPTSTFLYNVLDIPEQKKIILSVGRNHEKKGYDYGIKAMSLLVKRLDNKDAHYVIVGRGVSEHQSLVDELHANEYVSLIEEVPPEKITQCYKSADIFFSPSIVEGLSLVSIEAMASGLPLVVTDVPGNEDIVKANHCGVIVNSENVESMTEGLYRLLSDKPYTEELASIALSSSKKYDWSKIAEQYESVYSKAVEEHRVNGN